MDAKARGRHMRLQPRHPFGEIEIGVDIERRRLGIAAHRHLGTSHQLDELSQRLADWMQRLTKTGDLIYYDMAKNEPGLITQDYSFHPPGLYLFKLSIA
ncbi:MAG: hypothetical protein DBP01_01400 [gamma proteobacterium symbiont of Ctena orbiculata]|nr:MAG: hypothetical protein DBP01_01400 [gamma proteobacterium symbiont of Ctena orbiculata]